MSVHERSEIAGDAVVESDVQQNASEPLSLEQQTIASYEALKSLLSPLVPGLTDWKTALCNVLNSFAAHHSGIRDTLALNTSLNIGGTIYTNTCLSTMNPLLNERGIDHLRCLIHATWAPYMVRDKAGNVYLDMDADWVSELLDRVLEEEAKPSNLSSLSFLWIKYEARGFRHLGVRDKLGYQITRATFSLHTALDSDKCYSASEEFDESFPSSTQSHVFLSNYCGRSIINSLDYLEAEAAYSFSCMIDSEVHIVDKCSFSESFKKGVAKMHSDCYILCIEHANSTGKRLLDGTGKAASTYTALIRGKLQSCGTHQFLHTSSIFHNDELATGMSAREIEDYTTDCVVIGKNGNRGFIVIDFAQDTIDFANANPNPRPASYFRRERLSDYSIKLVQYFPIIHGVFATCLDDKLHLVYDSLLITAKKRDESSSKPSIDKAGTDCTDIDSACDTARSLVDDFHWRYKLLRYQTDLQTYMLLTYSQFMRNYLFQAYGLQIPSRDFEKDHGENITESNALACIEAYLQDISSRCLCSAQSSPAFPIVYFNVSGLKLTVLRSSIVRCFPESQLAVRVSGRWQEQPGDVDEDGSLIYNLPKKPFKALISYIRAYVMKPKLAKLVIEKEHLEDLKQTLDYLVIPVSSVQLCVI